MEFATSDKDKASSKLGITSSQLQNSHKFKDLWESVFDADTFVEQYEDKDLQSVAVLTGTIFSIFKGLKEKYENAQHECKALQDSLRAVLAKLDATEKDLNIVKERQCQQCLQLKEELLSYQGILEKLKSLEPILNCDKGLQLTKEALTPQKREQFICNVVRNILLGNEFFQHNETGIIDRNPRSDQRNAMEEKSSRKNLFGRIDSKIIDDKEWGATLAAASYPNDENIPPNFLGNNSVLNFVDTLQESPIKKEIYNKKDDTDAISNLTPKKDIDAVDDSLQNSPILCSSTKKKKISFVQLSQKSTSNERYHDRVSDVVRNCSQISPSLLNLDALPSEKNMHNFKMSEVEKPQQKDTKDKKLKTEVWELKPKPGLTKLKQTTLSVSKARGTVDLSKTPTFFGGNRVSNESNALINETKGNEETALATALQKYVKEIKTKNYSEIDAEDQEDFVYPSPTLDSSKIFVKSSTATRTRKQTLKNSQNYVTTMHCSQLDETLFAPAQTSTQNHAVPSKLQKDEAEEEAARNVFQCPKGKFETSFDRIPQKPSTSPNFKYRRPAVRKRALRENLEGWDCAECKKYYDALAESKRHNLKARMNRCSRHRDKYQFQFNTPPGFWDVNSLGTQETIIETPRKKVQR